MSKSEALYLSAAQSLRARFGPPPTTAFVLGSGVGPLVDRFAPDGQRASYGDVGLPTTGVPGHRGEVVLGGEGAHRRVWLSGRVHIYESRSAEEVARPVRALAAWGVQRVLLTSAVGSLRPNVGPGSLVRLVDHINLMGTNPLEGPNIDALGPRFPDLGAAYDPALGQSLANAAERAGVALPTGVYAAFRGPSYETPAEIRMLQVLGADVVGMSVVPEIIAGVHAGLRMGCICVVSNLAAGLVAQDLDHSDVTRVVGAAVPALGKILAAWGSSHDA